MVIVPIGVVGSPSDFVETVLACFTEPEVSVCWEMFQDRARHVLMQVKSSDRRGMSGIVLQISLGPTLLNSWTSVGFDSTVGLLNAHRGFAWPTVTWDFVFAGWPFPVRPSMRRADRVMIRKTSMKGSRV